MNEAPFPDRTTGRPLRVEVPAGIFAPQRLPAFIPLDPIGDPVVIGHHWLEDCVGERVSITPADAPAFRAYLRLHLRDILATDAVPLVDRAWAAHRALLHEVAFLFAAGVDGRPQELIEACRALVELMRAHFEPDTLFRSLRVDAPQTPVVHAVETAIGALAVALADGQRSTMALTTIAAAGAVADSGLLDLPRELRERAVLGPMELKAVQRHPDLAIRRMHRWGLVAPEALRAVRHHHERWDGEGYPSRLVGAEIPVEARYLAIADTYSALTMSRRGNPRLSRGDALREMARSTGQFDPALLRILVHLLAGQPAPVEEPAA